MALWKSLFMSLSRSVHNDLMTQVESVLIWSLAGLGVLIRAL